MMGDPLSHFTAEQLAVLQKEDNGPTIIAIVSVFTALGAIFVIARLYARLIVIRNMGLEDYCIVISFVRHSMLATKFSGTD